MEPLYRQIRELSQAYTQRTWGTGIEFTGFVSGSTVFTNGQVASLTDECVLLMWIIKYAVVPQIINLKKIIILITTLFLQIICTFQAHETSCLEQDQEGTFSHRSEQLDTSFLPFSPVLNPTLATSISRPYFALVT